MGFGAEYRIQPQRHANASATVKFIRGWSASGQASWIADRARSASDVRMDIGDYTTVDATLRYAPANTVWQLAASVRNLFDQDARELGDDKIADDFPLEGRGDIWRHAIVSNSELCGAIL